VTVEEMETEYWAHQYFLNPPKDEVEDEDFNLDDVVREIHEQNEDPGDWETVIE